MWRILLAGLLFVPKKRFVCEVPARRPAFVRHALPVSGSIGRPLDTRGPHQGALDSAFCDELWGHSVTNWKPADLKKEFEHANSCGWMPHFQAAAQALDFPCELLLAIASRETGMSNKLGDFKNGKARGYGIMQVDIGTDPEFCCTWNENLVKESIRRGAEILAEKRAYLAKKNIATTKNILAAYNAGQGTVWKYVQQKRNPDLATAGGNYGTDVMARKIEFAKFLNPVATK